MHLLFESLRPGVVIYSKIDLSLSPLRWSWWMASNADLFTHSPFSTGLGSSGINNRASVDGGFVC